MTHPTHKSGSWLASVISSNIQSNTMSFSLFTLSGPRRPWSDYMVSCGGATHEHLPQVKLSCDTLDVIVSFTEEMSLTAWSTQTVEFQHTQDISEISAVNEEQREKKFLCQCVYGHKTNDRNEYEMVLESQKHLNVAYSIHPSLLHSASITKAPRVNKFERTCWKNLWYCQ